VGLLNTILGRTKPVQANLDALFAIPSASLTLQSAAGLTCSGHAGVCFKPPTGQGFNDMQAEVEKLLAMDGTGGFQKAEDNYGYHWLVIENADIEELVTQIHLVNSSLSDSGWGPQLLCSVFGLAPLAGTDGAAGGALGPGPAGEADSVSVMDVTSDIDAQLAAGSTAGPGADGMPEVTAGPGHVVPSTTYLVYLFKRGTFYPFAPEGHEKRDLEQELKLKSLVANDLNVEADLDRWFPLWDLPVG
jgi:hypothetical protein